ncbi:MAG: protein-L-isoaspartate(D-aspartate) O-methyltransferase [Pseudomonadota bacterium]
MSEPAVDERRAERERMVEGQLLGRDIRDPAVLEAMRDVPREYFVHEDLVEFAYADSPLPIGGGQTISQPYAVARMAEAAELTPDDRVLEVGGGSGYAAAIYAHAADRVVTIERDPDLAAEAETALARVGVVNVEVVCADGSRGWSAEAPFDAILVAAGAPRVPESLKNQLAIGGRLVVPVSVNGHENLVRVRRLTEDLFVEERLGAVSFVPLIGSEGWPEAHRTGALSGNTAAPTGPTSPEVLSEEALVTALGEAVEPLPALGEPRFAERFDRLGDAAVVCLGEATHGTAEFYEARARITRRLVEAHGFTIVALEADWPDAARIDRYVRHRRPAPWDEPAFQRFPTWMWQNEETLRFVEWLRRHNADLPPERRVSVHGLDLYALFTSIAGVVAYLDEVDPTAAAKARDRYACLGPWQKDLAGYGRSAGRSELQGCERPVVEMLRDMLERRAELAATDADDFLDAEGNARLVRAAEAYYRAIYYGDVGSWNLRDRHMFETLQRVRAARAAPAKAVVWAHNSHLGDAAGTEMGRVRGELNLGQLCREFYGADAALVGFGTDRGTVMAARDWGGTGRIMDVRPARSGSIEGLCRATGIERFLFDINAQAGTSLTHTLLGSRLQRAIGVIYRPESELQSHYLEVSLPRQFDHYVWLAQTRAVSALPARPTEGVPDTYPFGL